MVNSTEMWLHYSHQRVLPWPLSFAFIWCDFPTRGLALGVVRNRTGWQHAPHCLFLWLWPWNNTWPYFDKVNFFCYFNWRRVCCWEQLIMSGQLKAVNRGLKLVQFFNFERLKFVMHTPTWWVKLQLNVCKIISGPYSNRCCGGTSGFRVIKQDADMRSVWRHRDSDKEQTPKIKQQRLKLQVHSFVAENSLTATVVKHFVTSYSLCCIRPINVEEQVQAHLCGLIWSLYTWRRKIEMAAGNTNALHPTRATGTKKTVMGNN